MISQSALAVALIAGATFSRETRAAETVVRHSSGVFMLTMPDGWGWRETPGPIPNGEGASGGGEALLWMAVGPATNDDPDAHAKHYLPLVQSRWFGAAVSGKPQGTMVGPTPATIYRLIYKFDGQVWELRTILVCRSGNVVIGAMRTSPALAAKYESSLCEILGTVLVRAAAPPAGDAKPAK